MCEIYILSLRWFVNYKKLLSLTALSIGVLLTQASTHLLALDTLDFISLVPSRECDLKEVVKGHRGPRGHRGPKGKEGSLTPRFSFSYAGNPTVLSPNSTENLNYSVVFSSSGIDVVPVTTPTAGYGFVCNHSGDYFLNLQANVLPGPVGFTGFPVGQVKLELYVNGILTSYTSSHVSYSTTGFFENNIWETVNGQWIVPLQKGDVISIAGTWLPDSLYLNTLTFDTDSATTLSIIRIADKVESQSKHIERGPRGHRGKRGEKGHVSQAYMSSFFTGPFLFSDGASHVLNFKNVFHQSKIDVVPIKIPKCGYGFRCQEAGTYFLNVLMNVHPDAVVLEQVTPPMTGQFVFKFYVNGSLQSEVSEPISYVQFNNNFNFWRSISTQLMIALDAGDELSVVGMWSGVDGAPTLTCDDGQAGSISIIKIANI